MLSSTAVRSFIIHREPTRVLQRARAGILVTTISEVLWSLRSVSCVAESFVPTVEAGFVTEELMPVLVSPKDASDICVMIDLTEIGDVEVIC